MTISQERIREICKSFVSGMDAEQIAAVEGLSDASYSDGRYSFIVIKVGM